QSALTCAITERSADSISEHFRLLEPALTSTILTPRSDRRRAQSRSCVVSLGGRRRAAAPPARSFGCGAALPAPPGDLGWILAVLLDVALVIDQPIAERLPEVRRARPELGQPVDHVQREVEPIEAVQHHHVERCRGRPLLP